MNKLIEILKGKRGSMLPIACSIVLSLFLVFTVVIEYIRIQTIVRNVKAALETSMISVAIQNYDDVYNSLREGYSGGYYLTSQGDWESKVDKGDVYSHLKNMLGLEKIGSISIKTSGDVIEYKLYNLKIDVFNVPIASSDNSQRFQAEGTLILEVPLSFGWDMLQPLKIKLNANAGYTSKF